MIEIKKAGIKSTLKVSKGAYESHFKDNGWKPVPVRRERKVESSSVAEGHNVDDRIDIMLAVPLSQWTQQDVKYFADIKGISLDGTKSLMDAKNRIKKAIDDMRK